MDTHAIVSSTLAQTGLVIKAVFKITSEYGLHFIVDLWSRRRLGPLFLDALKAHHAPVLT